jgi:DNA-binding CsgD family transcriptional regulator
MNWDLLNRMEYSNPKAVKKLLLNYDGLVRMAEKGDQVALCIVVDLRTAIMEKGMLTKKQRKYLGLWLDGQTQDEIAAICRVARPVVTITVGRAVKNISKFLVGTYTF